MARKDNLVKTGGRTRFDWPVQPDATGRSVETVRVDGLPNTKAGELQAALASYDTTAHPSDPRQLLYNVRPEWKGNGRWVVTKYYRTPPQTANGGGSTAAAPFQFDAWFTRRRLTWYDADGTNLIKIIDSDPRPRVREDPACQVSVFAGDLNQSPYQIIIGMLGRVNAGQEIFYGTQFAPNTIRMLQPRITTILAANGGFIYRTTYRFEVMPGTFIREELQGDALARGFPTAANEIRTVPLFENSPTAFSELPFA